MGPDSASSDSGESSDSEHSYGIVFDASGNASVAILVAVLVSCFVLAVLVLLRLLICKNCAGSEVTRRSRSVRNNLYANNSCHGLGREDMDRLPILSYSALLKMKGENRDSSYCCAVCLGDFSQAEEMVRLLPSCKHGFHPECIDMWLYSHTSCPVCRTSLIQGNNPMEIGEVAIAMPAEQNLLESLQTQA